MATSLSRREPNDLYQRCARGDQPKIPPVIENLAKSPLPGEAGPPPPPPQSPSEARRKIFRVFKGIFRKISCFLGKFRGFFRNFHWKFLLI